MQIRSRVLSGLLPLVLGVPVKQRAQQDNITAVYDSDESDAACMFIGWLLNVPIACNVYPRDRSALTFVRAVGSSR